MELAVNMQEAIKNRYKLISPVTMINRSETVMYHDSKKVILESSLGLRASLKSELIEAGFTNDEFDITSPPVSNLIETLVRTEMEGYTYWELASYTKSTYDKLRNKKVNAALLKFLEMYTGQNARLYLPSFIELYNEFHLSIMRIIPDEVTKPSWNVWTVNLVRDTLVFQNLGDYRIAEFNRLVKQNPEHELHRYANKELLNE